MFVSEGSLDFTYGRQDLDMTRLYTYIAIAAVILR